METLVDRVLDLSRLETGRLSLELCSGDLVAFAQETTRSFEPMAERHGVALHVRTDVDELPAAFDPDKLLSVLGNLIENALKFTPEGGKVLVRVERPDEDTAVVHVSDTGPGIPESERPHLFDRFHQGEAPADVRSDGSGLGLALVKELTELHGGNVEVESEVDMGTTFTVTLPLREPEEDAESGDADAPAEEAWANGHPVERQSGDQHAALQTERDGPVNGEETSSPESRPTLLIVEDNAEVRTYLRNQLSDAYCIQEATDGEEALDRAQDESPDLILSDVMMPEMDGMELCRRIKSDDALRDVPILLLTAKAGEEAEIEGLSAGADAYVEKPFSMETLRARIQSLLGTREALRDQYQDETVMQPSGVSITPEEEAFYEEARNVVEAHIGASGFTVEQFAAAMSVSRSTLRRRLKAATEMTPAKFVRHLRLERAAQLLREDPDLRIYEVADAVGYESPNHFARLFREHADISPTEYPADE